MNETLQQTTGNQDTHTIPNLVWVEKNTKQNIDAASLP